MADTRKKDFNWTIGTTESGLTTNHDARLATLMDIRDELKQLNRVFACQNFQSMPREIRRMRIAMERLDRRFAEKNPLPKGRVKS